MVKMRSRDFIQGAMIPREDSWSECERSLDPSIVVKAFRVEGFRGPKPTDRGRVIEGDVLHCSVEIKAGERSSRRYHFYCYRSDDPSLTEHRGYEFAEDLNTVFEDCLKRGAPFPRRKWIFERPSRKYTHIVGESHYRTPEMRREVQFDRAIRAARMGDRLIVGDKTIYSGLGDRSGLHSYATELLRDKWAKADARVTKKLRAYPSGTKVKVFSYYSRTRGRGNWLPSGHITLL